MAATYLAGVDLGTSVVKASLVRADGGGGVVAASATRSMQIRHPAPGHAEQDPAAYVQAALATLREALTHAGIAPQQVAAIAFAGQMGGVLAVDRRGNAVTPWYPSTLDTRYQPYLQAVMERHGSQVLALCGAAPILAPRLGWWRAEQPGVFARIHKVMLLANYVAAQLGSLDADAAFVDPSYLTWTGLADAGRRCWSPELAAVWEADARLLPRIVPATTVVGRLSPAAAAACGLLAGTPLVAGAGDQVAGFLGAGLVHPGQLIDVAGTFPVFATCLDRFLVDAQHGILQSLAGLLGDDHWYAMMYIGGGGLTHRWFAEQLGCVPAASGDALFAALDAEAAALPPGAGGLLFLPHLAGRACPADPGVRGAWLGLTWTHTRGHLYRALLESIAYDYAGALAVLRENCPHLALDEVRVIGGGANSRVWNQIKADVLGLPYLPLAQADWAALGCAVIGGNAVGLYPDMAAAAQQLTRAAGEPGEQVAPRPAWTEHYRPYVAAYQGAFGQLRELHATLAGLRALPLPG